MVGYCKNAPKNEEWLLEKIEKTAWIFLEGVASTLSKGEALDFEKVSKMLAEQVLAKMKEGGWVSPADLKDALSREMAAGFRLGRDKSKEVNDG